MKVKSCDLLLILAALVVVYLVYRHYRKSKEGMQFQGTIDGFLKNTPDPNYTLLMRADDPL